MSALRPALASPSPTGRGLFPPSPLGGLGRRLLVGLLALALLALFLARAPLLWGAALVFGGIGAGLLIRWPTLALYALAFAIPFGSLYELRLGPLTLGASEILLAAMTATWLARRMAFRRRGFQTASPRDADAEAARVSNRVAWAIGAYLAALALALLPARELTPAIKELLKWIEFAVVFAIVTRERALSRTSLVAALLLAGSAEALVGVYQFLYRVGPEGFLLFGRFMRASGTFEQPNPFGGYLGLTLPLAYATALTTWREAWAGWRARRYGPAALWTLAVASSALMAAGLVMSWSRGALLGLAAGAALVIAALGRRAWIGLVIAALVLALAGGGSQNLAPAELIGRVTETLDYVGQDLTQIEVNNDNFAVIERAAHWIAAWRMFERSPWLGVGVGQYAAVYPEVAVPRWRDPLGHAHNYLLHALAETGLVGLAAYLALIGIALAASWRVARRRSGLQQALALGALGMLGHLFAHGLFDNLYVHEMYLLVALILSIATDTFTQGARTRRRL